LQTNEGVCARNYGIDIAKGNIIIQIDDDCIANPGWSNILNEFDIDNNLGAIGPCGALLNKKEWIENKQLKFIRNGIKIGDTVDFLTGYFYVFRNCGVRYPTSKNFHKFWQEEPYLQFELKSKGYKLKTCSPLVCTHRSLRKDIDWEMHDANLKFVYDKWKDLKIS
jgi:glycosyltransferase involved in cell wall biosynthesis